MGRPDCYLGPAVEEEAAGDDSLSHHGDPEEEEEVITVRWLEDGAEVERGGELSAARSTASSVVSSDDGGGEEDVPRAREAEYFRLYMLCYVIQRYTALYTIGIGHARAGLTDRAGFILGGGSVFYDNARQRASVPGSK